MNEAVSSISTRRWLVFSLAGVVFVAAVVAALVVWYLVAGPGAPDRTEVTLAVDPIQTVSQEQLDQAGDVLEDRLVTAGLDDPRVTVEGDRLVASFDSTDHPSADRELVDALIVRGELQFRKVLEVAQSPPCADPAGPPPPDQPATVCDDLFAYEVAPAAVTSDQVDEARAAPDPAGNGWQIEVTFTVDGQPAWTELTREASTNAGGECRVTQAYEACQVAMVLDGRVISAPQVLDVIAGPAIISGVFTDMQARLLAAQVGHGSLPVRLEIESYQP